MNEAQCIASTRLAQHAATCRMQNSLEWMEVLAERLNEFYAATGMPNRVETWGYSLAQLDPPFPSILKERP